MKKSIAAMFWWFARTGPLKHYCIIPVVFLAGCIATQNRWQATQMRQQVMDYYNDEIMENLICADQKMPFVHVDITGLTTIDTSQIAGAIGGGETPSFTRTSPASNSPMLGAVHTIERGVMRPFSYSVAPQRGNSLQISAAPVLGKLSNDTQPTEMSATEFVETKKTETQAPPGSPAKQIIIEKTPKPSPNPKPTTIYKLYEEFVHKNKGSAFRSVDSLFPPSSETYVPGTLKRWGGRYYYINNDGVSREKYYAFCKILFTKSQAQPQSTTGAAQATQTAIEGVRGLQAIPPLLSPP
ncbi:MAG: hypothetical protein ACREFF_02600 [Candidatus Udaeobacter sp.]